MFLALRLEPRIVQAPRLQLKLQHTCATCLMAWPTSDDTLRTILDVVFGDERPLTKYHWCVCGRIVGDELACDRNYRARWRRRRNR
jgi:hypothetical protein